ncbi:hypothetical protein [Alkaliphilus serpentinus]|uniref:Lipoprotein n=1 Tax=Alkaliphilus serpentinus TaxID=1482731 RepID=A0A833MA27_9FIRM|nr:hypothetical protein [Alkaliphilus serpentinus]KAB3531400.1 hypothetical protein F8153_04270 [Alkaliphilus serpentinus]
MKMKVFKITLLLMMVSFVLTGCVPGDGSYTPEDPAGFLWGVWHGWIAPISLILSFFKDGYRLYEVVNTGFWYDFGFYIAVISGFGGISLARRKKD